MHKFIQKFAFRQSACRLISGYEFNQINYSTGRGENFALLGPVYSQEYPIILYACFLLRRELGGKGWEGNRLVAECPYSIFHFFAILITTNTRRATIRNVINATKKSPTANGPAV